MWFKMKPSKLIKKSIKLTAISENYKKLFNDQTRLKIDEERVLRLMYGSALLMIQQQSGISMTTV